MKKIQKDYFYNYSTTLSGMMKHHKIDANEFLDFVHDVNLDFLKQDKGCDMGIKFDGTFVKNGSRVVANMKRNDELKEGSSSGGKTLGNIKRRDEVKLGSSSGGKTVCNVKDGNF